MKKSILSFLILFLLIIVSAPARGEVTPSEDIIKKTVSAHLQKQGVPPYWISMLLRPTNTRVELVEIEKIGNFNEQKKYWPVKVRVKGMCEVDIPFPRQTVSKPFDRSSKFLILQDDFGEWEAQLSEE